MINATLRYAFRNTKLKKGKPIALFLSGGQMQRLDMFSRNMQNGLSKCLTFSSRSVSHCGTCLSPIKFHCLWISAKIRLARDGCKQPPSKSEFLPERIWAAIVYGPGPAKPAREESSRKQENRFRNEQTHIWWFCRTPIGRARGRLSDFCVGLSPSGHSRRGHAAPRLQSRCTTYSGCAML